MLKKMQIPSYCEHKPTGQAYVRLNGKMHYLGAYDTADSKSEYNRLIAEWIAGGRVRLDRRQERGGLTVNEVLLAFLRKHADYYVRADGSPTGELKNIKHAMRPLKKLYGRTLADDFGPKDLKAVRQHMIEQDLSRNVINGRVNRIKRVFRWAVSEELILPEVDHGLRCVTGLRKGRSKARETDAVGPVPDEHVSPVLEFLPPTLKAMVQLHRLCGMRSQDVCNMRWQDIDTSCDPWIYEPAHHKTTHLGHNRIIPLGPKAQEILTQFKSRQQEEYIFSPAQAQRERRLIKRMARQSKVQPSQVDRSKDNPKEQPGDRYTSASYYRAIQYAIGRAKKAGTLAEDVHWHPHQLRHACATEIRRKHGLDASRAILGHRSLDQTAEYAELDLSLATEVACKVG